MVNASAFDEIHQQQCSILLLRGESIRLMEFDDERAAKQAFGYLMEAIKRGENLVHL